MDRVRLAGRRPRRALSLHDPVAFDLQRFLLSPGRLAVAGALAAAEGNLADLTQRSRQPRRQVARALAQLVDAGIAACDGEVYRLVPEALRDLAAALPQPDPPDPLVLAAMTAEEQEVLARFVSGRRLVEIPAQRGKRQVVLQRLALDFEPGRHYTEREVNAMLTVWHPDYATLRRYLVDEGFLDRSAGRVLAVGRARRHKLRAWAMIER